MLKITDLTMSYPVARRYKDLLLNPFQKKKATALHNINIEVEAGDRVAFLGSNGAGKTTLLKLIGGLLYPTQGSISINGFDTVKANQEARRTVGFILNEERSFYWRLTGVQNLQFFGTLDNMSGRVLDQKIEELIGLVGLGNAGHKLVATYSSGMKQKLAIARGLMADPGMLILDEPTRTLDPIAAEEIKELIQRRIHHGKERTLLIATHSMAEAEVLCNKVCIMKGGHMLAYRTIADVKKEFDTLLDFYKQTITQPSHEKSHQGVRVH